MGRTDLIWKRRLARALAPCTVRRWGRSARPVGVGGCACGWGRGVRSVGVQRPEMQNSIFSAGGARSDPHCFLVGCLHPELTNARPARAVTQRPCPAECRPQPGPECGGKEGSRSHSRSRTRSQEAPGRFPGLLFRWPQGGGWARAETKMRGFEKQRVRRAYQ